MGFIFSLIFLFFIHFIYNKTKIFTFIAYSKLILQLLSMGNTSDKSLQQKNSQKSLTGSHKKIYQEEYQQTYLKLKKHPDFFVKFLHESPNFGKNLYKLFPKALETPQNYIQMVAYLRKYQPLSMSANKQAQQNSKTSTLLQRFLMICLGNISYQYFQQMKLPKEKIEQLLLDYYQLFIENPKQGTLLKAVKYIELQQQFKSNQLIPVKQFSEKFRQHFPHVQKFLKDYYYAKFHSGVNDFRVLWNFKSKILKEDAIILALKLPQITRSQVCQLYNSDDYGMGLPSIQKKIVGYTGPWLLLIQHIEKNEQNKKCKYVFGTYQNGPIKDLSTFQGDLTGFLFSIEPNIRFMTTDRGSGGNHYFIINNRDEKVTKRRKGIGFGGTGQMQNFKLWIDEDMDKSKVFNGNDPTYGYGALAGPGTNVLSIVRMEVYGLGTKENVLDQELYWKERHEQIMKRRKIDKTQFFDESSGLFFQKTLAHRDQVYGQIQKTQSKKQSQK